jgi:ADP-ribose pyrophosphatase YjhB (NUDIX family)
MEEVAAGGIVYRRQSEGIEILLIRDRFGRWTVPKGRIEPGETLEETALREIEEETGVVGRIKSPIAVVGYHYQDQTRGLIEKKAHYYLVEAIGGDLKAQIEEIDSAHWFKVEDARKKQREGGYPNNTEVLEKGLRLIGQ